MPTMPTTGGRRTRAFHHRAFGRRDSATARRTAGGSRPGRTGRPCGGRGPSVFSAVAVRADGDASSEREVSRGDCVGEEILRRGGDHNYQRGGWREDGRVEMRAN